LFGAIANLAEYIDGKQKHHLAARKLDQLDSAARLEDLQVPPGNRLEALEARSLQR